MPKSWAKKQPKKYKYYSCAWCGEKKREDKFFKCSIDNEKFICRDCIKAKSDNLSQRCSKANRILILCHLMDIPYYWDICKSLCDGEDIGIYIRQCNLHQYDMESFEQSFIEPKLDYEAAYTMDKAHLCTMLDELQHKIETIKNEI